MEWYPTLQLRWARRSTSRMAVLQQQFFNGKDYEWRDVPVIDEELNGVKALTLPLPERPLP